MPIPPIAAFTFGDATLTFVFALLGVLGYLIIRGHTMHEHQAQDQSQYAAFRQFQRRGPSGAPEDDLSTLADLKDRGLLTDDEFERAKAKALR